MMPSLVVITGFMGAGKTCVGRAIARQLGYEFVDMDALLEEKFHKSIQQIFHEDGEHAFRTHENLLCLKLSSRSKCVIATGGGTLVSRKNFNTFSHAAVICLDAEIEPILKRIAHDKNRPLLANETTWRERIGDLLEQRLVAYRRIFHHVATDDRDIDAVATEIFRLLQVGDRFFSNEKARFIETPPIGSYPIFLETGCLSSLGAYLEWLQITGRRAAIISNTTVWPLFKETVSGSLKNAGFSVHALSIADGETYKTASTIATLYEELLPTGITRHDVVIALGGGVVGDLSGFVAATYLRGVPCVQIPTTLLAMVDASVGGKTGYDTPQGKNLVGAFHQPRGVLIDPQTLNSLPDEHLRAGLAEVIKHALIGDPELFAILEHERVESIGTTSLPMADLIRRALAVKTAIVEQDPFEKGRRAMLNLGHTFGHAIELVSGFTVSHGFAVAIGLVAAAELAVLLGASNPNLPERLRALLRFQSLPTHYSTSANPDRIFAAMQHDKKRTARHMAMVIPLDVGVVDLIENPNPSLVLEAIMRACKEGS